MRKFVKVLLLGTILMGGGVVFAQDIAGAVKAQKDAIARYQKDAVEKKVGSTVEAVEVSLRDVASKNASWRSGFSAWVQGDQGKSQDKVTVYVDTSSKNAGKVYNASGVQIGKVYQSDDKHYRIAPVSSEGTTSAYSGAVFSSSNVFSQNANVKTAVANNTYKPGTKEHDSLIQNNTITVPVYGIDPKTGANVMLKTTVERTVTNKDGQKQTVTQVVPVTVSYDGDASIAGSVQVAREGINTLATEFATDVALIGVGEVVRSGSAARAVTTTQRAETLGKSAAQSEMKAQVMSTQAKGVKAAFTRAKQSADVAYKAANSAAESVLSAQKALDDSKALLKELKPGTEVLDAQLVKARNALKEAEFNKASAAKIQELTDKYNDLKAWATEAQDKYQIAEAQTNINKENLTAAEEKFKEAFKNLVAANDEAADFKEGSVAFDKLAAMFKQDANDMRTASELSKKVAGIAVAESEATDTLVGRAVAAGATLSVATDGGASGDSLVSSGSVLTTNSGVKYQSLADEVPEGGLVAPWTRLLSLSALGGEPVMQRHGDDILIISGTKTVRYDDIYINPENPTEILALDSGAGGVLVIGEYDKISGRLTLNSNAQGLEGQSLAVPDAMRKTIKDSLSNQTLKDGNNKVVEGNSVRLPVSDEGATTLEATTSPMPVSDEVTITLEDSASDFDFTPVESDGLERQMAEEAPRLAERELDSTSSPSASMYSPSLEEGLESVLNPSITFDAFSLQDFKEGSDYVDGGLRVAGLKQIGVLTEDENRAAALKGVLDEMVQNGEAFLSKDGVYYVAKEGSALGKGLIRNMQNAQTLQEIQNDIDSLNNQIRGLKGEVTKAEKALANAETPEEKAKAQERLNKAQEKLKERQETRDDAVKHKFEQATQFLAEAEETNALAQTVFDNAGAKMNEFIFKDDNGLTNDQSNAILLQMQNGEKIELPPEALAAIDDDFKLAIDEYNEALAAKNRAQTDVEKAQAEKEAAEAEVQKSDNPQANISEANGLDLVRMALEILTVTEAENDLSVQEEINVKSADVKDEIGEVEDTALAVDDMGEDASSASTVVGAASTVADLLSAAVVDLNLLSEDVEIEVPEVVKTYSAGGTTPMGSQTGPTPTAPEKPQKEDEPEDTTDPISEAKRQEIERRRDELMGQYVNAAIQVAEGMNAISNKFLDRAAILAAFSGSVQTEAAAFGLAQDVGRYVLLETLRGVALSSIQMGVQATRLLKEQTVEVSNDKGE